MEKRLWRKALLETRLTVYDPVEKSPTPFCQTMEKSPTPFVQTVKKRPTLNFSE